MIDENSTEVTKTSEENNDAAKVDGRKRRGFGSMSKERVREIAASGGRAAHAAGTAHQFTRDEARVAGRKGGIAPHKSRGRKSAGAPE